MKTMDLVLSLGKEVRERDNSVMIPGLGTWWCLSDIQEIQEAGPGLGAEMFSCGRLRLSAVGTPGGASQPEKPHTFLNCNMMLTRLLALCLFVLNVSA